MKKIIIILLLILAFVFYPRKQMQYVNVCNWYGMLPKSIVHKFESETGIKIRYDVFDNNEVLEAKLMATNSGYDVVFPSASPYVAHQLKPGVYMKLDKEKLPNLINVDPFFLEQIKKVDPEIAYAVPYVWGTTGILYNADIIHADAEILKSVRLIFDPEMARKFAPLGIALLDEIVDVAPMVLRYLKKDPALKDSVYDIEKALFSIRRSVKTFATDRLSQDLLTGSIALCQFWSGDAYRTIQEAKNIGRNLTYIIPHEGASLWIDVMAIPEGAPNPENAHKFINFMLRPDIAAELSNATYAVTTITKSRSEINRKLIETPFLYPNEEVMKTLQMDLPGSKEYESELLRMWAKVRQNKDKK